MRPPRLVLIVEGQGDVLSVPHVIRRVAKWVARGPVEILRPIRVRRYTAVREGEFERHVELAARLLAGPGAVLILLDADDDLPCRLGPELLRRAEAVRPGLACAVVLAKSEKEAWFLASVESLRGQRGIRRDAIPPDEPESVRGAKEWLGKAMGRPYSEVTDQPELAKAFDLSAARQRSPSFDKFCREVARLLPSSGASPEAANETRT